MNARFELEIPQELRELTDSNIFYKYQIYFSCLTGVLIDFKERQKNITRIDSTNQGTQTTIRSSLIQDLYLKFADESEEDITFIDSDIKARKDHLLTVIFVRYPGTFDKKEYVAVYNQNLNKSFLDRNFFRERWSNFSGVFLKAKPLVQYTFFGGILLVVSLAIFSLIFSFLNIYLEGIYHLIFTMLSIVTLTLVVLFWLVSKINDDLMKRKVFDRLENILEIFENKETVVEINKTNFKDTTEFEYIDEWN